MGEIKLVPRNEVDKKYTWDMTLLYKSDKEFINSLEKIKKDILEFKKQLRRKISRLKHLRQSGKRVRSYV